MKNSLWFTIVIILLGIIGMLGFMLMNPKTALPPTPTSPQSPTTTPPVATPTPSQEPAMTPPLSAKVVVDQPKENASVSSSFTVSGKAPGNWFFEASFPIQIRDENNNVIGRSFATAQGEWMTTELVPFTATVSVEGGYKGPATLILLRDNPSGLPEIGRAHV